LRRLLNDLTGYPARLWDAASRGWGAFFFTPADPTALGVIRVIVGLLILWNLAVYGLALRAYFGSDGWDDLAIVRIVHAEQAPGAWSFWSLVPDGLLWAVWAA